MIDRMLTLLGGAAAVAALAVPASIAAQVQQVDPAVRSQGTVLERCLDPVANRAAADDLTRAIMAAVRALPANRSNSEDIEATILYTISQRNLCPGVARTALDGLGRSGTPAFTRAVAQVRNSLLERGVGTAGLRSAGGSFGAGTLFTPPVIGIGGGSATYSR